MISKCWKKVLVLRGNRPKLSYAVTERDFELSELKILLDCVQVSKFISENRTEKLTKKLCSLCSRYEATQLRGQVHRNHVKAEITRFIIILIRYIRQSRINCFYLFNISSIYLQRSGGRAMTEKTMLFLPAR